ncbi:hypothetical protein Tco_1229453 [Tanacetum coccineum]
MVPVEEDNVERFIGGLPDNIQGNVIAAKPTKLQDAIRIANNLLDQKLKGYARSAENKRRPGHFKKDCPKLRNQFHGNQTRNKNGNKTGNQTGGNEATTKAYAIGRGGTNHDSNIVTGHPFDIDLMPVELGSFDVIIDEVLIIRGDNYDGKPEDKSKERRLEDVAIVWEFPKVFPEDLPGLPPT